MNIKTLYNKTSIFFLTKPRRLLPFVAIALPLSVNARTVADIISDFQNYALDAINFLLVLATLVFLWGIIKYINAGGDAAKVKEARSYILWGIIGLAVMGGAWAIVKILGATFGVDVQGGEGIPQYDVTP